MRVAVCFACDEVYMPLAKGLVLSLLDRGIASRPGDEYSLQFIDIGCQDGSRSWLERKGAAINGFSRERFPVLPRQDMLPRYADALLCRPFLPKIVPGYDVYVWIDCDTWVQGRGAINDAASAVSRLKDKIVICPELHYGYIGHRGIRNAVAALQMWYKALYRDEGLAETLSFLPIYNAGVFAMRGDALLWEAWAGEMAAAYSGDHSANPRVLHFAEQLSLNKAIHDLQAQIPLDPLYNYACGGSSVFLNPQGKVVVGYPPCPAIKIVHLLDFPRYGKMYLDRRFLYDQGRYLSEDEKNALAGLVKPRS